VPVEYFECQEMSRSSLVTRVCYSAPKAYMVIRLKATDYHYCDIDQATVDALSEADSMGRHYNQNIKDAATAGRFSCRDKHVPTFP